MPYYKVVDPDLKSTGIKTELSKEYVIGIPIKPKIKQAPLFVFDNLSSAINYVRYYCYNGRIFECSIKKSKNEAGWGPMCPGDTDKIVKNIKSKKKYRHILDKSGLPPAGTVFADEVILGQEVMDFEGRVFYKVVDPNLKSCMKRLAEVGLQVQYAENKPVRSNNPKFPLMVFSDLRSAKDFILDEDFYEYKIFNCRIVKSSIPHKRFYLTEFIEAIRQNVKVDETYERYLIRGTVFADEVTLINEVIW